MKDGNTYFAAEYSSKNEGRKVGKTRQIRGWRSRSLLSPQSRPGVSTAETQWSIVPGSYCYAFNSSPGCHDQKLQITGCGSSATPSTGERGRDGGSETSGTGWGGGGGVGSTGDRGHSHSAGHGKSAGWALLRQSGRSEA